jgi:hypothetical protein
MSLSRHAQSWIKGLAYRCGFSLRRLRTGTRGQQSGGDYTGKVRPLLHKVDPYAGFDWQAYPADAAGWGSDSPAFGELVATIQPQRIIEVGTWKARRA